MTKRTPISFSQNIPRFEDSPRVPAHPQTYTGPTPLAEQIASFFLTPLIVLPDGPVCYTATGYGSGLDRWVYGETASHPLYRPTKKGRSLPGGRINMVCKENRHPGALVLPPDRCRSPTNIIPKLVFKSNTEYQPCPLGCQPVLHRTSDVGSRHREGKAASHW